MDYIDFQVDDLFRKINLAYAAKADTDCAEEKDKLQAYVNSLIEEIETLRPDLGFGD